MMEFILKTIIADETGEYGSHTIYLANDYHNIIIPIRVDQNAVNLILLSKENRPQPRPNMHDTTVRIIKSLGGCVEKIIIDRYERDIFYSYLRIKRGNENVDIDTKPSDSISIALKLNVPIFITENVIEEVGIKLTSEMLQSTY